MKSKQLLRCVPIKKNLQIESSHFDCFDKLIIQLDEL